MVFFAIYFNEIGILGVFLVLLAYFLLQIGKMQQTSILFSLLNTLGSVFILVSLFFVWNLPSGIIEIAWLLISLFGLLKSIHNKFSNSAM